ncbi:MAG: hypothetical protein IKJ77_02200 [Firmicutes bacterium]|nr:hypothetical protein [Bacillota bacterium]
MKELIVIIGSLLLGCLIFDMIAGDGESLKTAAGIQMEQMLQWYRE